MVITATMKATGINTVITGGTLELATPDAKSWSCTGGNLASRYRPSACR